MLRGKSGELEKWTAAPAIPGTGGSLAASVSVNEEGAGKK